MDPIRRYEINAQVCRLKTAYFQAGAANNQSVIAAITGQKILVMGWIIQGNAATGSILFKSASAGTQLIALMWFPASTSPADKLPVVDSGYFETNVSEGLFADVATAAVNATIFYITYTP